MVAPGTNLLIIYVGGVVFLRLQLQTFTVRPNNKSCKRRRSQFTMPLQMLKKQSHRSRSNQSHNKSNERLKSGRA
eukprot:4769460-Amphidinium_carterae.1